MQHLIQVLILALIASWGLGKLAEIPAELAMITGLERRQKRKNLAQCLATQRDPLITIEVEPQEAEMLLKCHTH